MGGSEPGFIVASTISGNSAEVNGGGVLSRVTVDIVNSTITGNTAQTEGGGVSYFGPRAAAGGRDGIILSNTIIAGNSALVSQECSGLIRSLGHNLSGDDTCKLNQPTDLSTTNPLLGPLQNNGGPTDTHALLPGSPAIDAGDDATCPDADQRGIFRPQGLACDMGAVETN